MKKEDVILSCYSLLRQETPLKEDCGKICNGKCCKGDSNTGMILFPGEENLIDENIEIKVAENGEKIAVCNGTCNRNKRPLSCRLYPLFPLVENEDGKEIVRTIIDLRADCPLTSGEYKFNKAFVRKVKKVGKYLLLNDKTKAKYLELSDEINEVIAFLEKIQKN